MMHLELPGEFIIVITALVVALIVALLVMVCDTVVNIMSYRELRRDDFELYENMMDKARAELRETESGFVCPECGKLSFTKLCIWPEHAVLIDEYAPPNHCPYCGYDTQLR